MRRQFVFIFALCVAGAGFAASLHPASDPFCTAALTAPSACEQGETMYFDQNDNCGCLLPQNIVPAKFCRGYYHACDKSKGESYSALYAYQSDQHIVNEAMTGCGCFTSN